MEICCIANYNVELSYGKSILRNIIECDFILSLTSGRCILQFQLYCRCRRNSWKLQPKNRERRPWQGICRARGILEGWHQKTVAFLLCQGHQNTCSLKLRSLVRREKWLVIPLCRVCIHEVFDKRRAMKLEVHEPRKFYAPISYLASHAIKNFLRIFCWKYDDERLPWNRDTQHDDAVIFYALWPVWLLSRFLKRRWDRPMAAFARVASFARVVLSKDCRFVVVFYLRCFHAWEQKEQ